MYINPYRMLENASGTWFKSNFHAHAGTQTDTLAIQEVVNAYQQAGYGILTISNQYMLTDTSRLAAQSGMTLINGYEYIEDKDMLCIGAKAYTEGSHQHVIDRCTGEGGFVILCHPHYLHRDWWPVRKMLELTGYEGIEIYNGVIFQLPGSGLATDTWDTLLSGRRLVWGFGNDDFHRWDNIARAWNMIYSPSGEYTDIMSSVGEGCFYVSTGLTLDTFTFADDTIEVGIDASGTFVKDCQYLFIGRDGNVLDTQFGVRGRYRMKGDELYARVQVISEHGSMLWTQPVYDRAMEKR